MNRKEEVLIMWQIENLLRNLLMLLNRKYFDDFLELDKKERQEADPIEWLFPELRDPW
ncbi:MAG: hypothetical protein KJ645_01005 [Planctomycetes bacterium]|nr:hypothetical protein [Planctomycetota bacterium]